jgi:hypothetical protein
MRDEWEIQELYDSGDFQKYHPEDLMNWILNGITERKFDVGEHAFYLGYYKRKILDYDSNDNTYKINFYTRDIWVNECELKKYRE